VAPSPFRKSFVPSKPKDPRYMVRCDFGSPWVRLAWLLTFKEELKDLGLVYSLANIAEMERAPCPENEISMGPWWGLVDENLFFVPNFVICPRDKANIEALLPAIKGAFTRLPESARAPYRCSLRQESRRFARYLDVLEVTNDEAIESYLRHEATSSSWDLRPRKLASFADPRRLIEQARNFSVIPECPRNLPTTGGLWHYMTDIPDLTVCPECYAHVIRPELTTNSVASTVFTPTPQKVVPSVPSTASLSRLPTLGPTCQMYSKRMQRAWHEATDTDDVEHLVRTMRERRAVETHVYHQKMEIESLLARTGLSSSYKSSGMDGEMLKRDLVEVEKEWEKYE
jgi:hypothetical protein